MIRLILNDRDVSTLASPFTSVLDFLRGEEGAWGTREGCGTGGCGTCAVLVSGGDPGSYRAINSCMLLLQDVVGRHVVTIEGLGSRRSLTCVQRAIVAEGATQCGFCTPGIVLALTGFLTDRANTRPEAKRAINALDGNICRCTGYASIKRAARSVCAGVTPPCAGEERGHLQRLVDERVLPPYFRGIPARLEALEGGASRSLGELSPGMPSVWLAGGTALRPGALRSEDVVVALSEREELRTIEVDEGRCSIGAAVTLDMLGRSPLLREWLPNLREDLERVASTAVRQRATVGGNIASASPSADLAVILLALRALLVLRDREQVRVLSLEEYFAEQERGAPDKEVADSSALIVRILLQRPLAAARFNFEKVSRRAYLDVASVNTAILLTVEHGIIAGVRISAGGVAATPRLLARTAEFLRGKEIRGDVLKSAVKIAQSEVSPSTDVRGSAGYKLLLLRQLIYAHFVALYPEQVKGAELR